MRIVSTWNLKAGVDADAFEDWLLTEALPAFRALPSVDELRIYRTTGMFGVQGGAAPFAYVEVLDVADPEGFGRDMAGEAAATAAARLREDVADMVVVNTEELSLAGRPDATG